MTQEEVREDVRRMRNLPERTLRSRRLSPEERIRILRLRGQAQLEEDERRAADAPVDELADAQGESKRARVNLLEENKALKIRIIGYLNCHYSELKVNDNPEEVEWERIIAAMIEGNFNDEEAERIFDDLTGKELDLEEVRKARRDEIDFVKDLEVYEEVPVSQCWANTGKAPIGTRW